MSIEKLAARKCGRSHVQEPSNLPPAEAAPGAPIRILLVEDHASVRQAVLFSLRASGFEAFGAEDGVEGVELARRHRPDLILMDIQAPGLISAIRAQLTGDRG